MRKPHHLLARLAPIVMIALSPADGSAQATLEPGVINIAEVQWSAPSNRPCYPLGVQTAQLGTDPDNGGPAYLARFPAGSQFALHWHTHHEFVVVVNGNGTIVLDDQRHALSPGSYVVIPGRVAHSWHVPPGGAPLVIQVRRAGPADFHFVDCATPTNAEAELLWRLEERYITAHVEADHQTILSLWDEEFLGWPSRLGEPSGKAGGAEYLAEFFPTPMPLAPRIERLGIRFTENVAMLFFRLHWGGAVESGSSTTATTRLTHTWVKRGSEWRILGGMDWTEPSVVDQKD
jgi:quercetin dioxygenase-like cupin family protein/ketosteroid isomerase-like protein